MATEQNRALPPGSNTPEKLEALAVAHAKVWDGSSYYDDAERWLYVFWRETHPFLPLFNQLDISHLLELACGHGRHSEYILDNYGGRVNSIVMMDILQSNVDYSRNRLGSRESLEVLRNNGVDFRPVADASRTAVFCYDAMVHFHRDVVRAYLLDAARVLVPGGKALFHHSNFSLDPDSSFGTNPSARAFMSAALFKRYAESAGLQVLEQKIIDWGRQPALDCISLLQRPASP